MEALYAKLHDRYTKLKAEKFSELDQLNQDQEEKFVNYVSVAEDIINHLKNENNKLLQEINDLRSDMATIRSNMDERNVENQKLLMEEHQKNKALSDEVERLRKLEQEGLLCSSINRRDDTEVSGQPESGGGSQCKSDRTNTSNERSRRKRRRNSVVQREDIVAPSNHQDDDLVIGSAKELCKDPSSNRDCVNIQRPECCRITADVSGGGGEMDSVPMSCLFQALIEYLLGMKLSVVIQADGICISALHQSSGYSFSLTWIDKAGRAEPELLYRVLSLGTFDRIAPDWMRDVLLFSTSMCPVFFERVLRVIKLHQ